MRLKIVLNFVSWLLLGLFCSQTNGLDARHPFNVNQKPPHTTTEVKTANSTLEKRSVTCLTHHVIESGDTCWDIKNRYGLTLDQVYELNPGIECNTLVIGRRLCIYGNLPPPPPPPPPSACTHFWVVSSGDICYNIANKLQISLDTLFSLNPGIDCDNLRIDQRICIKTGGAGIEPPPITRKVGFSKRSLSLQKGAPKGCKKFHTAEYGESCWLIALNHGLDLADLLKLNPNLDCDPLFAGYNVCVDNNAPTVTCQKGYKVKSGDTCFKIANMYSMSVKDLEARNAGLNCNLLQINKTICINKKPREEPKAPVTSTSRKVESAKPVKTGNNCSVPPKPAKCSHYFIPDTDVTCETITKFVGLQGVSDLLAMNPGLDCNKKRARGYKVCIHVPNLLKCSLYFIADGPETEQSVSSKFGLVPNALNLLNNKKVQTVNSNQFVCVQMNVNGTALATPSGCQKTLAGYFTNWDFYNTKNIPMDVHRISNAYTHVMYSFMTLSYSADYDTWYLDTIDANADFLWKTQSTRCMDFLKNVHCEDGKVSLVPYLGAGAAEKRCPVSKCYNAGGSLQNRRKCHTHLSVHQVCGEINHLLNALHTVSPETAVMLTIGGWYDSNYWTKALSPRYVDKLVTSIVSWLQALPFDGIDIDWEHPGYEHEGQPGPSHMPGATKVGNPDLIRNCKRESCEENRSHDLRFFLNFLNKLRSRLSEAGPKKNGLNRHGKPYEISIAVTGHPSIVEEWPLSKLCSLVDRVNLMTYDYNGGWSSQTEHHAPLYGASCRENSVECSVKFWVEKGCPRHKLILGVPTYARVWKNVSAGINPRKPGYRQAFKGAQRVVPTHKVLHDPSFAHYWDASAKASFAYSVSRREFASYDDTRAVQEKARRVNEWGLGGMMVWKMGSDDPDDQFIKSIRSAL